MTPIIEDSVLSTDLDAQNYFLLNLGGFSPTPANLVTTSDPRLTDARMPLPGSVTDASVAVGAAIAQSKLALTDPIPPAWLGTGSNQAAKGSDVEYIANKNIAGGYAGLDGTGKIPSAALPAATGTGTITSAGLTMPAALTVTGSPITASGTFAVAWASVADQSWFGNNSGSAGAPQFYTTPLPASLIPSLDASIITSGAVPAARLPAAVGVGGSHAPGAVPDPGASGTATDYLARDMTYKAVPSLGPTYQPTIPNPTFGASANLTGPITVTIADTVAGCTFFYSLTSSSTGFLEWPSTGYVSLPTSSTLWAYAARPGYNNSAVVNKVNTNP